MDVRTLCLGVLSFGETSGYGIRKAVEDWFGHFAHASLGAIYPALAKAVAKGEIEVVGPVDVALEKRVFRLTDIGRASLVGSVSAASGEEILRSPFMTAMFFAHLIDMDDVHRVVDERLAGLRREQRRLRGLPSTDMTEGQRFTIRYALAMTGAAIAFMEREGRAMVTAIDREKIDNR
ncbi:MAG: PadR family transcriptional regulator [Thalassobaculaceae bacterium]|nr:PadR family transcriptional regulator [Thalassobaculaceae bacterium]